MLASRVCSSWLMLADGSRCHSQQLPKDQRMRHQKWRHDQRWNEECRAKRARGLGDADNDLVIGKEEMKIQTANIAHEARMESPRTAIIASMAAAKSP